MPKTPSAEDRAMFDEFAAAARAADTATFDMSSPGAFMEGAEQAALRAAVAAFHSWVLVRTVSRLVRQQEEA